MGKPSKIRQAAQQIADILEVHLAKLPPGEREERHRAFREAVAKVGARRDKSGKPEGTPASRAAAPRR